jgi:hypothetical protein
LELLPWQRFFGTTISGFAPSSASQAGFSSEELVRDLLTGVSQNGFFSEKPRRVSSTEDLPRKAPWSPLRVFLHRASSSKLVFEAAPLRRFFGTSILGNAFEGSNGDLFGGTTSAELHGELLSMWLLGASP